MQLAIDPMTYERSPVSYDLILEALTAGGFNCDRDDDGDPIIITEKNMIVYCSLDPICRSIMFYTLFFGEDANQDEKEDLVDSLDGEFELLTFAIRRGNLHVRIYISCIAGLNLPELYLAAQTINRDVNTLVEDPRVHELFPLRKNRGSDKNDGIKTN